MHAHSGSPWCVLIGAGAPAPGPGPAPGPHPARLQYSSYIAAVFSMEKFAIAKLLKFSFAARTHGESCARSATNFILLESNEARSPNVPNFAYGPSVFPIGTKYLVPNTLETKFLVPKYLVGGRVGWKGLQGFVFPGAFCIPGSFFVFPGAFLYSREHF